MGQGIPLSIQLSGGVRLAWQGCPPTLTGQEWKGEVGPQNLVRTENVTPVSRRRLNILIP